ncbi:MAG TPA: YbjN domain-containing protein [Allosphingosinicella sp.]|jgi:hypothetical protein
MVSKWVGPAWLAVAIAVPAEAQMVTAKDPQSVVRVLHKEGYTAKLEADKGGEPMISSGYSGSSFRIFFYNCTQKKDCATVQFYSGYTLDKPVALDRINAWNSSQRFGRAYLNDKGEAAIEMDIDLDDGGVSEALFTDNLEYWVSVMGAFEKHIGFRD